MHLEALVGRIRSGDKGAIRELVSVYGSAVYQRALERLQDKELAREAARQIFGQFVSIVQQQAGEDGWLLWFGDLIERNLATYAQIGIDMGCIEEELEREIYETEPPAATPAAKPQPRARESEPPDYTVRSAGRQSARESVRDGDFFDRAPNSKRKGGAGRFFGLLLRIILCLLLLWVVGGVGMAMRWFPYYDLGYTWFNQTFFNLF